MTHPETKKVGFHRGKPRLYFQSPHLSDFGFGPGARYDIDLMGDLRIEIRLHPEGRRAVCKKAVGPKVFSIIDINSPMYLSPFQKGDVLDVTYQEGLITLRKQEAG